MRPALFLDRDGTINRDCPYCKSPEDISIYEDVYEPLRELSQRYYMIILTNQSGIARGYFSERDLELMNEKIRSAIAERGGRIDAIYVCPHMPGSGCQCRKPATGLLERALHDFEIDRAKSFVIGDSDVDMEMAKRAGIKSIRIRNDSGNERGDFYADDFYGVLRIVNGPASK